MDKCEMILEALKNASNDTVVDLWNEYCNENNSMDDYIFDNGESFFEENFSDRVMDAVRSVQYGDYNVAHDYVCFNGYGNLESFNCADDENSPVDFDSLADWLIDNKDEDEIAGLYGVYRVVYHRHTSGRTILIGVSANENQSEQSQKNLPRFGQRQQGRKGADFELERATSIFI